MLVFDICSLSMCLIEISTRNMVPGYNAKSWLRHCRSHLGGSQVLQLVLVHACLLPVYICDSGLCTSASLLE